MLKWIMCDDMDGCEGEDDDGHTVFVINRTKGRFFSLRWSMLGGCSRIGYFNRLKDAKKVAELIYKLAR